MKEQITESILTAQNPDGGWGAQRGQSSNIEATAFALLALGILRDKFLKNNIDRGVAWLVQMQKPDGSFPYMANLREGSWASPLAVIALNFLEPEQPAALRGAEWVLRQKGRGLGMMGTLQYWWAPERSIVKLNPLLKGWSWTSGTFSWVEPTAYALVALKKLKSRLDQNQVIARVSEAERMVYDRMCVGGGWNYGNSNVLGESLWPYPDITALALISLQDRRTDPPNRLGLKALQKMLEDNHSGLALAWSILCFDLYGNESSQWIDRMEKSYSETGFLGETKPIALALLASSHGDQIFRV